MDKVTIYCFGEMLWDILPTHRVAGGAPMNVAIHLANFGQPTAIISRVGADEEGQALLHFLKTRGVSTHLVQTDKTLPTGRVTVQLTKGQPTYEIVQPVAWDAIQTTPTLDKTLQSGDYLVFGSLACRSAQNLQSLTRLLQTDAYKVFDVNLRRPFYKKEVLIHDLLPHADLVKMNDEELDILTQWLGLPQDSDQALSAIRTQFGLKGIILTKGKDGADYCSQNGVLRQAGFPISVKDTIGSGDAFLAGFLHQKIKGQPAAECLRFGCATGALVATFRGGTPVLSEGAVRAFVDARRKTPNLRNPNTGKPTI